MCCPVPGTPTNTRFWTRFWTPRGEATKCSCSAHGRLMVGAWSAHGRRRGADGLIWLRLLGVACRRWAVSLLALAIRGARWCRRPLGRPKSGTSASPARACGWFCLPVGNPCKTSRIRCAERWAVVLSVLLLLWLARVLRGPCFFSRWFSGLLARALATKRFYLRCFVAFAFPGWLAGCSFWAAVSAASGARARPHVSLLVWALARAQKAGIPGIIWGLGGQHA